MKYKRGISLIAALIICVCMFTACGSSTMSTTQNAYGKATSTESVAMDTAEAESGGYAPYESDTGAGGLGIQESNRKIIRNAYIDLEAKQYDETLTAIYEAVTANAGYISNSESYGNEAYNYGRSSNLVLRIPSKNYNAFLTAVKETGNVIHLSEGTEDVTESYYDIEARLKTLQVQEERLLALLEKADSLEDVIKLEEQLSNVRYQIESAQGKLKLYDNQIDYATITVNVQEVKNITVIQPTFLQKIKDSFVGSISLACEILEGLLIGTIYLLPYGILAGILVWIIMKLVKKHDRKQMQVKQHTKPENKEETD